MQLDRNSFQAGSDSGVTLHDQRIMARYDMGIAVGQRSQAIETFKHLADMERTGERTPFFEVLVEMTDVRGQHNPSARRANPVKLQSRRVSTGIMHADARGNLAVSVMEMHTLPVLSFTSPQTSSTSNERESRG
mgnify:CR=1 FL=1